MRRRKERKKKEGEGEEGRRGRRETNCKRKHLIPFQPLSFPFTLQSSLSLSLPFSLSSWNLFQEKVNHPSHSFIHASNEIQVCVIRACWETKLLRTKLCSQLVFNLSTFSCQGNFHSHIGQEEGEEEEKEEKEEKEDGWQKRE